MNKVSLIGGLLKRNYRSYSGIILSSLEEKGFTDLRASFLEILIYLSEKDGPSIKDIGKACGLKKQTMTSHLNELQKRGYIVRRASTEDKREQKVFFTEYGQKFKFNLLQEMNELQKKMVSSLGDVELDRAEFVLEKLLKELEKITRP